MLGAIPRPPAPYNAEREARELVERRPAGSARGWVHGPTIDSRYVSMTFILRGGGME